MQAPRYWILCALMAWGLSCPFPARAHDVDGPNDCTRNLSDMGDAPEDIDAYPGYYVTKLRVGDHTLTRHGIRVR